jgi:hypothetical protein
MKFTQVLKRLMASRRNQGQSGLRRRSRLPQPDDLEFSVIPATDDSLYDQDVMPALLARILATEKDG